MVKKNKNLPDELISKKIKQIKNLTNELSISDVQKLNKLTDEQVSKVLKKLRAEIKNNEKFYGGMNYIDVEAIINSVKNPK
jgi:tyrosyl-tRNA synthetase